MNTLQAVANMEEARFLEALEEAVRLSVLEERPQVGQVRYRFTHAFFRQVLYEELIAPQRLRFHQQIARALEEQYVDRLHEHASELAEHFSHSTDPADLKKAVHYGAMAARAAVDVYAYGESVRLLEQTIKVQQVLDPEDKAKQCDLMLELCDTLLLVADGKRIIETEAPAAFELAKGLGDSSLAARACGPAIFSILLQEGDVSTPHAGVWVERLDHCAEPDTVERAYADALRGVREYHAGPFGIKQGRGQNRASGLALLQQGLELARRIGDQNALWHIASLVAMCMSAPKYAKQRMELCEELWNGSHRGLDANSAWICFWTIEASLAMGHRELAEEVLEELRALAERTGSIKPRLIVESAATAMAVMDGRLEDAIDLARGLLTHGEEGGVPELAVNLASPAIRAQLYQGAPLEALRHRIPSVVPEAATPISCLVEAHAGQKEEASNLLERHVLQRPYVGTSADETFASTDSLYLEAAVLVGHLKAAELLLTHLGSANICTPSVFVPPTCLPRHLGGAASLLGRYDEARRHYERAIQACSEMSFRPELALSRMQLAELLLEQYADDGKVALGHLDFAIGEFREMKMQPSLERAVRLKEALQD